jgi:hypothetical protein
MLNYCILLLLSISLVICPLAKAIYSHPDLSKTSKKYEGFTIDFKGIDVASKTYWSLCNWGMDLTEFKKSHKDARGGGAYSGLKMDADKKTGILSFWEVSYQENGEEKTHRATRMYPKGKESTFA